ncbi:hypothetical protein [Lysinibacillus fusiformis]
MQVVCDVRHDTLTLPIKAERVDFYSHLNGSGAYVEASIIQKNV